MIALNLESPFLNGGKASLSECCYDIRWCAKLGDNCFQNFHLGRHIVRYMFGNFVLQRRQRRDRISDDITPEMKILNMVIHMLMHFCIFVSNWSV